MRDLGLFLRILRRLRPCVLYLVGSVVCTGLYALLSGAGIWMIGPFMKNVFQLGSPPTMVVAPDRSSDAGNISYPGRLIRLKRMLKEKTDALILGDTQEETLKRLCWILFIAFFLKGVFNYGQRYLMAYVDQRVVKDFRDDLYAHLHRLSLSYFHRNKTGNLISRVVNDVGLLNEALNVSLVGLLRDPLMVLVYLGIMVTLSWQLALSALLIVPASFWIIAKLGRKIKQYSLRSQEGMGDIASRLQETLSGIRIVKAFAMEAFEIAKFRRETDRFFRAMIRMTRVRRLASPLTELLGVAVGVIILWIGGRQVLAGELLAPEDFMTFLITMFLTMQPIKNLSQANARIQIGLAAGGRLFQILDTEPEIVERKDAVEIQEIKDRIDFAGVSFWYDGEEHVLQDVDLTVRQGERVAIVGRSGAGKSTLVDLIPRFYDPIEGRVEIDGVDIRNISIPSLRRLMGMVAQETVLFNDTVRNNIAYGSSQVSDGALVSAAKAANAHGFIRDLPRGYETPIGDRGARLSGGQRQRLAIARALLKNPPILILDEATSALDSESEVVVQEAIERLMENRTSFVIAHRLSTVRNADRIIVLEGGRIVQQGNHRELMAREGPYRKLYTMQFRELDTFSLTAQERQISEIRDQRSEIRD